MDVLITLATIIFIIWAIGYNRKESFEKKPQTFQK